jgi:hypothetical protein
MLLRLIIGIVGGPGPRAPVRGSKRSGGPNLFRIVATSAPVLGGVERDFHRARPGGLPELLPEPAVEGLRPRAFGRLFSVPSFEGHSSALILRAKNGGPAGIRTLDTLLGYTPLAGERFRPLSHRSLVRSAPRNHRGRDSSMAGCAGMREGWGCGPAGGDGPARGWSV